jgi:uncharacterized protein
MARPKLHGQEDDLHRAIQRGDLDAVRAWISAGKPLEARDPTATTPLGLAAYFNKPAIFQELLAGGAKTEPTDDGNHVLFYAAWRGSRKMVQALLGRGLDVNFQCKDASSSGQTALIGAAKGGHLGIVKLLVAHGADLALTDRPGLTALDHADENGQDDVLEFLKGMKAPGKAPARKPPTKPHPGEEVAEGGREVVKRFPKLAAEPAYRAFLDRLTKLAGRKQKANENPHAFEYGKLKGVYGVHLPAKCFADRPHLLAELSTEAAEAGGTLVEAEFGQDLGKGIDCVLFPTTDKAAVVLAQETSSNGTVGAGTEDILAFLADLDQSNPFRLTICAHDTIAGEFVGPVRRAKTFARRLLEICPGESEESPEEVATTIKRDRAFFLWWD